MLVLKLCYRREQCHATHTKYFLLISVHHVSLSRDNVTIITTIFLILKKIPSATSTSLCGAKANASLYVSTYFLLLLLLLLPYILGIISSLSEKVMSQIAAYERDVQGGGVLTVTNAHVWI